MRRIVTAVTLVTLTAGVITAATASASSPVSLSITGTHTASVDVTMPTAFTLSTFPRISTRSRYAGIAVEDLRAHRLVGMAVEVSSPGMGMGLGLQHGKLPAGHYRFILIAAGPTTVTFGMSGPTRSLALRATHANATQAGYRHPPVAQATPAALAQVPLKVGAHPLYGLVIGFSLHRGLDLQYGDACITKKPVCELDRNSPPTVIPPFFIGPCWCGIVFIQTYDDPRVIRPGKNHAILDTAAAGVNVDFTMFGMVVQ